ncbi:MAG: oligosaccharyl transferase, archaeosortase A system-associated, partial [Methanosarcina sp.]
MLAKVASPSLYSMIINTPHTVFGIQTGGPSTIQEVSSMFEVGGQFTLRKVFDNFTAPAFLISTLGLLILIPKVFQQKSKPQELVVLIWSVFMLLAIYGQNRFGYYYSINVSILSAYVGGLFLEMVKWDRLEENFRKDVKSLGDAPKFLKSIRIEHILAVLIILVVLVVPQYNKAMTYANVRADPDEPWTEATTWLRTNTPDPGMDFNGIYDAPDNGQPFDYPENAYGVMSWWDYGHYIETIGNRMPNANPFQAGIGGRSQSIEEENRPGAVTFLTAQSEEEASAVLEAIDPDPEKSGARYIISDNKMAIDIFSSIIQWTLDTEGYYQSYWTGSGYQTVPSTRYFNSMEARLHLFDANGLKQYRLVHETWPYQTAETGYKQVYNLLFGGNVPTVDTGYVKIFEYVKGAKITGVANPNDTVNLRTTILTGQQRTFEYSQSTVADSQGNYAFTVPYSTEGPLSGQTQFDV